LEDSGLERRIHAVGDPVATILRGIAVRKGEHADLLKALDKEMAGFSQTEGFFRIYARWHAEAPSYWTLQRVSLLSGGIIGLIVLLMLWWRYRSMRRLTLRLREALKEAEKAKSTLRGYMESAQDGILVLDADLQPSYWNVGLESMLGMSSDEIASAPTTDFFILEDGRDLGAALRQAIEMGASDRKIEAKLKLPSGKESTVEISISRETGPSSKSFILIIHDITSRKRMMEDLQEKNRELEKIAKVIVGRETAMIAMKSKLKSAGLDPGDVPPPERES